MNSFTFSIYQRQTKGLTLIEVIVSIVFAAIILAALSVPLSIGLINRSQGKKLTEATNLAQAQMEAIRSSWMDPQLLNPSLSVGQDNFDNNIINFAWRGVDPCSARAPRKIYNGALTASTSVGGVSLLSDPSKIGANDINIPGPVQALDIDVDNNCTGDYWGQIILGNTPDSGGNKKLENMKRVVIRIFPVQAHPSPIGSYVVPTANPNIKAAALSIYSQSQNQDNVGLPLVVLVADIPRP